MKSKIIILTSLFLLFVILFIPAKIITNFIPAKSDIAINGIDGSVWSGKIADVNVKGWTLKDVDFDTQVLSLVTGKLGADVNVGSGDIQGDLAFTLKDGKNAKVNNANLKLQSSQVEQFIPFKGVEVAGEFETMQLNLSLVESKLEHISGATLWNNGSVVFNGKSWQLGDFYVDWNTSDNGDIHGKIRKSKNIPDMQGDIKISKQGLLEFSGSIANNIDKPIFNAFLFFADGKSANGRQALKFKKKIW